MAYFANGSEGMYLDEQCEHCIFGNKACPIYEAQYMYNYDAVNNKVATDILNTIVDKDGNCRMLKAFPMLRRK